MTRRASDRFDDRAISRLLAAVRQTARPETCPDPGDLIDLVDAQRSSERLDAHLTSCFDCALEVDRLQRLHEIGPLPGVRGTTDPSLLDRLRGLVTFEMPRYLVLTTRAVSAPQRSDSFASAMAVYGEGRYVEARELLAAARWRGDRTQAVDFYLGACLMQERLYAEATEALRSAVKRRPRVGEYRWYLAQALLLDGCGHDAVPELERAASLRGPYREPSHELVRQLRAILSPSS